MSAKNVRKSRPQAPGTNAAEELARMIRVDHAGEYGAVRIYQGQLAVLGARKSKAASAIRRMEAEEQRHLAAFDTLINERRDRLAGRKGGDGLHRGSRRSYRRALCGPDRAAGRQRTRIHEDGCAIPRRRNRPPRRSAGAWRARCARLSAIERNDQGGLPSRHRVVDADMNADRHALLAAASAPRRARPHDAAQLSRLFAAAYAGDD